MSDRLRAGPPRSGSEAPSGGRRAAAIIWDRAFGTFYDRPERPKKSPTVFKLGYTEEIAKLYPHDADLSGGVAKGHPRERIKG